MTTGHRNGIHVTVRIRLHIAYTTYIYIYPLRDFASVLSRVRSFSFSLFLSLLSFESRACSPASKHTSPHPRSVKRCLLRSFYDKGHHRSKSSFHAANVAGKLKVTFLSRDANSLGGRSSTMRLYGFVRATMHSVTSFLELINWKINESINENYRRAFTSEEGRFFFFLS